MLAGRVSGQRALDAGVSRPAARPAPRSAVAPRVWANRFDESCSSWTGEAGGHDLVLSSGFLAFAYHSGFLQAVEEAGLPVAGVMGTSAGALTGSLYAAGYSPRQVARHLSEVAPINLLRPSLAPWAGGLMSLDGVVARLRDLLPPRFEDLQRDFAVGVVSGDGEHVLIDSGPLPEAVAASAAIPLVFSPVEVPDHQGGRVAYQDGGVVDRIGLKAWRNRRRAQLGGGRVPPAVVHVISRSSPFSGADDPAATGEAHVHVVSSPKSGVSLFDLGEFDRQFDEARRRARPTVESLVLPARTGAASTARSSLVSKGAAAALRAEGGKQKQMGAPA